jgi:hypothetical protein
MRHAADRIRDLADRPSGLLRRDRQRVGHPFQRAGHCLEGRSGLRDLVACVNLRFDVGVRDLLRVGERWVDPTRD